MKKFSTAARAAAFAPFAVAALLAAVLAGAAGSAAAATQCAFRDNAPDRHLVVRGDTLWDISGKFLQHPWCWPQVWNMNREQIRNPHWIYPGQIVYLDRAAGRLRLAEPAGSGQAGAGEVRLSPRIRSTPLAADAIPAIPAAVIEPFLSQPLIVEENQLQGTPRIVATQEGRVFLGKGDKAYVRGALGDATDFQVFRPGVPLKDPVTKAVLGYEAAYLGSLKLQRAATEDNEAHTFIVTGAREEIGVGDRLLPTPLAPIMNYVPHAPATAVDARVVSIYGGVSNAGQNQVVAINRGRNEGIDVGTTLELYRFGQIIADRTDDKKPVKLPDERYGTLFVFRVFEHVSYGLIMQVTDSVQVGDVARSPE
ncbi:MAG: LysM peptidoglycan-binding domain-containing protein [Burkholderiaceae bacterium]